MIVACFKVDQRNRNSSPIGTADLRFSYFCERLITHRGSLDYL